MFRGSQVTTNRGPRVLAAALTLLWSVGSWANANYNTSSFFKAAHFKASRLLVTATSTANLVDAIVDPANATNIYALSVDGSVLKSTDAGANWTFQCYTGNAYDPTSYPPRLIISPASDHSVYVDSQVALNLVNSSGAACGVISRPAGGYYNAHVTVYSNGDVYAWAGPSAGLFKSTNQGTSWTLLGTDIYANNAYTGRPAIDPNDSQNIVVHRAWPSTNAITRSTNGGATFTEVSTAVPQDMYLGGPSLWFDPVNAGYVYHRSGFKSTDSGATWSSSSAHVTSPYTTIDAAGAGYKFIYSGSNVLLQKAPDMRTPVWSTLTGSTTAVTSASTEYQYSRVSVVGVTIATVIARKFYLSTNSGTSFTYRAVTDTGPKFMAAISSGDGTNIYAIDTHWNAYRSTNMGATWQYRYSPTTLTDFGDPPEIWSHPANAHRVSVRPETLSGSTYNGSFMTTSDGFSTATESTSGFSYWAGTWAIKPNDPLVLAGYGSYGFKYTLNGATSFTTISNTDIPFVWYPTAQAYISPNNGDLSWFAQTNGTVSQYNSNTNVVTDVTSRIGLSNAAGMEYFDTGSGIYKLRFISNTGTLSESTDDGATFTVLTAPQTALSYCSSYYMTSLASNHDIIAVACRGAGVFSFSTNGGKIWKTMNINTLYGSGSCQIRGISLIANGSIYLTCEGGTYGPYAVTGIFPVTPATTDPCAGSPSIGAVCSDGSIYAGVTPDNSVGLYAASCDYGQVWNGSSCTQTRSSLQWSAGASVATGVTSLVTGKTNTSALIALNGNADGPYEAANTCGTSTEAGHNDWYLPALSELNLLYTNFGSVGGLSSGSAYWSASESSAANASQEILSTGSQSASSKTGTAYVRCVRKNTAFPFAFTNQTGVNVNTTTTSNAVTLAGFGGTLPATCGTNCSAIKVNGTLQGTSTRVSAGQNIALQTLSSATPLTAVTVFVTVGSTISNPWLVTTNSNEPGAFGFTNQSGISVNVNTTITSNAVTLSGFGNIPAVCGTNCTGIKINGTLQGTSTRIQGGQSIAIQQLTSSAALTSTTAYVTVGTTQSNPWITTTNANDPGPFAFTNVTALAGATVTSDSVVLTGFGDLPAVCGPGCTSIKINGTLQGTSTRILGGQTVAIRQIASSSTPATTLASVTVGTRASSAWSVTTGAADIITSGTSFNVTPHAGFTTAKIWVIGAGGGGAGATNSDATSGGGGAAGGMAYTTATIGAGFTLNYSLGASGAGGVNTSNGSAGGATYAIISGVTVTGNGGGGGGYNNNTTATGGTYSGGAGGANGGTGAGVSGDTGGGSGGAIGTVNGATGGSAGGVGASAANVSGYFTPIQLLGYSTTAGGTAGGSGSSSPNAMNGGAATGFGAGGGGAGYYGGNGGAGYFGGGGGGASGYTGANMTGGAGGAGVIVIEYQ